MSHNKITVAGQSPNTSGEITVSINNLSDVDTSGVANNDYLVYNSTSSQFEASSPVSTTPQIIFIGKGETANYSGSGASGVTTSDDIEFYDSSVVNNISNATVTSASNWVSSITLPAGSYRLLAVAGLELSASSGLLEYRWHDGTNAIGTTGNAGYTDDRVGNPCVVLVEPTANTTYTVRITTATSVTALASQTSRQSQRGYIVIEQV